MEIRNLKSSDTGRRIKFTDGPNEFFGFLEGWESNLVAIRIDGDDFVSYAIPRSVEFDDKSFRVLWRKSKESFLSSRLPAYTEPKILYFAYGSNMDPDRISRRVRRENIRAAVAALPGYRISFNQISSLKEGRGVATIEEDERFTVYGKIFWLTAKEVSVLDAFEGTGAGNYIRVKLTVNTSFGERSAYTYMGNLVSSSVLLPSMIYLRHIFTGSKGLPTSYIRYLLDIGLRTIRREVEFISHLETKVDQERYLSLLE